MTDTIFALSSGQPPAGVAVIRLSGPGALGAAEALGGPLPPPRTAMLRTLRDPSGEGVLDRALVLAFPAPRSVTGEDMAELHCHGGRAVVAAVMTALGRMDGLRQAEPGEFTRRAFAHGRMDLAEAEGLADLLQAETELQRRSAQAMAGGALSRQAEIWRSTVLQLSAMVEAVLDFSDEDDVAEMPAAFSQQVAALAHEWRQWLDRPRAEALREGYRVVLAGPPNAGKSTLFNVLVGDEAAIATPIAGTTRDVLQRSVAIAGTPFTFCDTAGLHDGGDGADPVEAMGIARARKAIEAADLVLWLGPMGEGPHDAWEIEAMIDRAGHGVKAGADFRLSASTGEGIEALRDALVTAARSALPQPGTVAINRRQAELLAMGEGALTSLGRERDLLLIAEHLRQARQALDSLVGRASTEDMLDTLFGQFCIGK